MIESLIDPLADLALDVTEIDQHPAVVKARSFQHDHCRSVMAVQMPALAAVVQQPVPITKVDFLRDAKHISF
jgi:hypothetical protein